MMGHGFVAAVGTSLMEACILGFSSSPICNLSRLFVGKEGQFEKRSGSEVLRGLLMADWLAFSLFGLFGYELKGRDTLPRAILYSPK